MLNKFPNQKYEHCAHDSSALKPRFDLFSFCTGTHQNPIRCPYLVSRYSARHVTIGEKTSLDGGAQYASPVVRCCSSDRTVVQNLTSAKNLPGGAKCCFVLLDGAGRRRQLQAKLNTPCPDPSPEVRA